MVRFLELKPSF